MSGEKLSLFTSIAVNKRPRTDNESVLTEKITLITNKQISTGKLADFAQLVKDMGACGIVIGDNRIALKADQVKVLNGNNEVAMFEGGKLSANLINAKQVVTDCLKAGTFDAGNATINNLIVTNAQVTGKITATSGSIGGFEIGTDRIGLPSESSNFGQRESEMALTRNALYLWSKRRVSGNVYDYKSSIALAPSYGTGHIQVVDDDVLSGSETARALIYLRSTSPSKVGITSFSNKGLWINIKGASEDGGTTDSGNHALWIESGDIAGLRLNIREVNSSYTITKYDNILINYATNGNTVLTLPSASDCKGQVIFIINKYNYGCTIEGTIWNKGYSSSEILSGYGKGAMISDGAYWIWFWFKW